MAKVTPRAKRPRQQDSTSSLALPALEDASLDLSPLDVAIRAKASEVASSLREAAVSIEQMAISQPQLLQCLLADTPPQAVQVSIQLGMVVSFCNPDWAAAAAAAIAAAQGPFQDAPDTVPAPAAKCAAPAEGLLLADAPTATGNEGSVVAGADEGEEVAQRDGPGRPPIYDDMVTWAIREKLLRNPHLTLKDAVLRVNQMDAARHAREVARRGLRKATAARSLAESTLRKRVKTLTGHAWTGLKGDKVRGEVLDKLKDEPALEEEEDSEDEEEPQEQMQEEPASQDNNNQEGYQDSEDDPVGDGFIKQMEVDNRQLNFEQHEEDEHALARVLPGTDLVAMKLEPMTGLEEEDEAALEDQEEVGNWFQNLVRSVKTEPIEMPSGSDELYGGFMSYDAVMRNSTPSQSQVTDVGCNYFRFF